jgi:hypothetical protein
LPPFSVTDLMQGLHADKGAEVSQNTETLETPKSTLEDCFQQLLRPVLGKG